MDIPGITAIHAIISDACRTGRGDEGAIDEALRRARDEYRRCLRGWPVGKGAKFHVVLTVERPAATVEPSTPPPTVDRSQRCMTDGSPETPDHREIDPKTGMQKGYVVLTPEERSKGFVRPLRRSYVHDACGGATTISTAIAETYARDPGFYGATFCAHCQAHFAVSEFRWGDGQRVGE